MQFTYVDLAAGALVLISAYLAYSRGVTRELLAIGGWVLAALAAFYLAPVLKPLLNEAPVIGSRLAEQCVIAMIVAFALVMAAALLVLSVFTPIFSSIVMESALGPIDRAFGFLFGAARGVILIAIALLIHSGVPGDPDASGAPTIQGGILSGRDENGTIQFEPLRDAAGLALTERVAAEVAGLLPDAESLRLDSGEGVTGWFAGRLSALMSPCETGTPTPAAASGT